MIIEKVNPVVVDEIEFYISKDKTQKGMSQSALARLCGVNESTLRGFLARVKDPLKCPQSLRGVCLVFADLRGAKNAVILTSVACSLIIQHFALVENNKTAQFTLNKFATIGVNSWIDQVTGCVEVKEVGNEEMLAAMRELISSVESIKVEAMEGMKAKKVTAKLYPGLVDFNESLQSVDLKSLPQHPNEDLVTCKEWLESVGLPTDHLLSFGRSMASLYRSTTGEKGQIKYKKINGQLTGQGAGYPSMHSRLFEVAYESVKKKHNL